MRQPIRKKPNMAPIGAGASVGAFAKPGAAMRAHLRLAAEWIDCLPAHDGIIVSDPISRLQRELGAGYAYTSTVAQQLVENRRWTVAYAADGTRYAQLHPVVPG
jgi:hypothetical protein